MGDSKRWCVIVGAGMAGLTAARGLQADGWDVVVVDKGRGVGGRIATRRMGEGRADHGAQFFTVRDERFAGAVARWHESGWIEPWFVEGGHTRYRGAGGMNAPMKHLAEPFDVRVSHTVDGSRRRTAAGGS